VVVAASTIASLVVVMPILERWATSPRYPH
jgi:hypothetical protein